MFSFLEVKCAQANGKVTRHLQQKIPSEASLVLFQLFKQTEMGWEDKSVHCY